MAANLKIMTPHVYSYSIVLFIYEYNIITKVLWQICRRQISLGWLVHLEIGTRNLEYFSPPIWIDERNV